MKKADPSAAIISQPPNHAVNMSQTSGASANTNMNMKTMVQTTDAEPDNA